VIVSQIEKECTARDETLERYLAAATTGCILSNNQRPLHKNS
jgi:hypothetical protein